MNRTTPICVGLSETGELLWKTVRMERWQEKLLYYKQYTGDFLDKWWRLSCIEKGIIEPTFEECRD